jgi:predicted TPR repeat methyltransferase
MSSGDLAADRRYQWGLGAAENGDHEAARDLFAQTLDLAPNWAPAWFALAQALENLGRLDEAVKAFSRTQELAPEDPFGAGLCLARLGIQNLGAQNLGAKLMSSAPQAYVRTLFDQYAATFDSHLVEKLAYRGPQLLRATIERGAPGQIFQRVLDLGCGAGLFAAHFRDLGEAFVGVDLSPAMIAQARAKNIYKSLVVADLVDFLRNEVEASADLAVAADVFVYIGDLAPVFAGVFQALKPGGFFAFSVQKQVEEEGWRVGQDLRYAHGRAYLVACAAAAGFAVREIAEVSTRKDRGQDVPGAVVLLERI